MRSIGFLSSAETTEFAKLLELHDIEHRVDQEGPERFEVWIVDDDALPVAKELLLLFRTNPQDERVRIDENRLREKRRASEKAAAEASKFRHVDARTQVFGQSGTDFAAVTILLIGISAALFMLSFTEHWTPVRFWLSYSYPWDRGEFAALRDFQIWRVFTPMFLHFGFIHILFNMMWLKDLGGTIETRSGSRYLLLLVLVFAFLSNTAQYVVSGANFGGMSGVVYGLLGYVWMRSRYEPGGHYVLHDNAAIMMLIWYFVCVFGLVGRIANVAHGMGLVAGMAWGLWKAGMPRNLWTLALKNKGDRWVLIVMVAALPLAWWADR